MSSKALTNSFSSMAIEVIAYHGWGFDRSCWEAWKLIFEQIGCNFQTFDRGYFGQAIQPEFKELESKKIILVHSYGLHLCPIAQLKLADVCIIFSSFLEFHPASNPARKRSQAIVQQMIEQLEQNPQLVLDNFRRKCYYPATNYPASTVQCSSLLLADLHQLNQAILPVDVLESIPKKVVFHGSSDRIVSPIKGQDIWAAFPTNSQYYEVIQAGHALPFTHLQECWSFVSSIFQALIA